jgi:hypothetical protein
MRWARSLQRRVSRQLKHRTGTAVIGVGSDSTVSIVGATVAINGTAAGVSPSFGPERQRQTNFVGRPIFHMGAGTADTWVAAVWAQANTAPNQNCPDGTIWISF